MAPPQRDGYMGEPHIFRDGNLALLAPDGDEFLMPPGGDVRVYLKRGFVYAAATSEIVRAPFLKNGDWAGRRCFVVGGGPSLKGFDWGLLDGELSIGINRAIEFYNPTASLSIDNRWHQWITSGAFGEAAKRKYERFTGNKVIVGDGTVDFGSHVQALPRYPGGYTPSHSIKYGLSPGGNSGYAAINLAILLGADPVYLLGFDCNSPEDAPQEHFHDGYPQSQTGKVYRKFRASFEMLRAKLNGEPRIINLNRESGIECFEFGDMPATGEMPLFVSGYTPDYAMEAQRLAQSLERLGLDWDIREYEDRGIWQVNCQEKPRILQDARFRNSERGGTWPPCSPAVVWIDADAELCARPDFFQGVSADFAAYRLGDELLGGTLYFGPGAKADELLRLWHRECGEHAEEWDQEMLAHAVDRWDGRAVDLPASYCRIFDHPKHADIAPVILHHQASRVSRGKAGTSCYVPGYHGLGDNIFQRPFVRRMTEEYSCVYLRTPCPELYWDIPRLRFVRPDTTLRTQNKEMARYPEDDWVKVPEDTPEEKWEYGRVQIDQSKSLPEYLAGVIGRTPDWTLPLKPEWIEAAQKVFDVFGHRDGPQKVCLVHPPTIRREWQCETRNPKPEYFQTLLDKYGMDYCYVSIADLKDGEEWLPEQLTGIDYHFDHGELPLTTVLGMIYLADMMICPVGLFMVAGLTLNTKTLTLWGGHLPPDAYIHHSLGLDRFRYVAPKSPCACGAMSHDCNKTLDPEAVCAAFEELRDMDTPRIDTKAAKRKTARIAIPAGLGDMHWILLKLEAYKRKNHIDHLCVCVHEDKGHINSAEYLLRIPWIDEVQSVPLTHWQWHLPWDQQEMVRENEQGYDQMIQFNTHLEQGIRVEEALPECETNWDYRVDIPDSAWAYGAAVREAQGGVLIVCYASSNGGNASWTGGTWKPEDWAALAQGLYEYTNCEPVLVGSPWDQDYADKLAGLPERARFTHMVQGTTVPQLLGLLANADAVVGFPSGVPILATHLKTPTVMFFPVKDVTPSDKARFLDGFQTAWVDPRALDGGRYFPVAYGGDRCNVDTILYKVLEWL